MLVESVNKEIIIQTIVVTVAIHIKFVGDFITFLMFDKVIDIIVNTRLSVISLSFRNLAVAQHTGMLLLCDWTGFF